MKKILSAVFWILIVLVFTNCTYTPDNVPFVLYVYEDTIKTKPIPGLRCTLKSHDDPDTALCSGITDSNGFCGMAIQVDNRFGTIDWESYYQDRYIEVTDVDGPENYGSFSPGIYQCWYSKSSKLNFLILERAPDPEE
ncbi:MAG: hypothetical protein EWM51_10010 [Treponema sp.]|nr:MAG: hypothetical protein EWM51_10010 [Treponema sp.]